MRPFSLFLWLGILAGLSATGCYPGGADFTEDFDIVYTAHSETYDFVAKNTYALPDKIVTGVDVNFLGDTIYEYMKDSYATPILNRIESNMNDLGWTKVDVGANPDLLLMPAGLSTTTIFVSSWYCWWYGGYWPGWGWYYPPAYDVSAVTTGSLVMTLSDPSEAGFINQSKATWLAVANGLLNGNNDIQRALDGIDQAFAQSPYLKTN